MDMIERTDRKEEILLDALGTEEFLQAITKALSYDVKEDIYDYILRVYDITDTEEETEE